MKGRGQMGLFTSLVETGIGGATGGSSVANVLSKEDEPSLGQEVGW